MTASRWQLIEQLFHSARAVEPVLRESWLVNECGGDESLFSEVLSLLSAEPVDDWMRRPPVRLVSEILAQEQALVSGGRAIGRYTVRHAISSGGMGEVYLADDFENGRPVALKLLRRHLTFDAHAVERFSTEARAAAALCHPNLVAVYEAGECDAVHFIAFEWVDGRTWRQLLDAGHPDPATAAALGAQAARGLDAVHSAGILHRDVKPENLMIRGDGVVKLLDFGLARLDLRLQFDPELYGSSGTISGTLAGTLHYMAPELLRGEPATAASDIFSLGVVLYELGTGAHPFRGETPLDTFEAIECRTVLSASAIRTDVPALFDEILDRMLDRDPLARPTAGEVAHILEAIARPASTSASEKP